MAPSRCFAACFCFVAALASGHIVAALPCGSSGYCSLGQVEAYFGNISPSTGLHEAARKRSYKQEIILMVSDIQRIDSFLQSSQSLLQLGLEHILLLSLDEAYCNTIVNYVPDVGCAWTTDVTPVDMWGITHLWNMRYRTLARLIRLGYNVLLLDSDTAMLDDPYKYFKQPPFNDIVVLNQDEDGIISTNGGILYVQNAAPDGPAAFMFAETVSRPYRWADDDWETATKLSIHAKCLYSDQDAYNDVLADMVSGYMVFPKAWYCLSEAERETTKWHNVQVRMYQQIKWLQALSEVQHSLPEAWHTLAGEASTTLRSLHLRMPNCRGWPEELGGQWLPRKRGPYSLAFLEQLQQDNPEAPLWPDAEDASNAAAADRIPTEKFAFMPEWLGIGYWTRGRHGYWDPRITGNIPQQVIAHTHFIDTHVNTAMAKRVVPMSLGLYNWTLASRAHGDSIYFACALFDRDCPDLRVLALTPIAEGLLGFTSSWEQFALVLQGLARMGSLLQRAVAWPSLPCNTSWISGEGQLHAPPLDLPDIWLPWIDQDGSLMCTPWGYAAPECLLEGRGLLPWEWQHFKQQQHNSLEHNQQQKHQQHEQQKPEAETQLKSESGAVVLHAVHDDTLQATNLYQNNAHSGIVQHVVEIDAKTGLEQAMGLEDVPMLLLDSLVHMALLDHETRATQSFHEMLQGCLVLNVTDFEARFELDEYSRNSSIHIAASHADMHAHRHLPRKARLHRKSQNAT